MPYVWDGHDNATRVQETGHGFHLHRQNWTENELTDRISRMLEDESMKTKLKETSAHMQSQSGPNKAAGLLNDLLDS